MTLIWILLLPEEPESQDLRDGKNLTQSFYFANEKAGQFGKGRTTNSYLQGIFLNFYLIILGLGTVISVSFFYIDINKVVC